MGSASLGCCARLRLRWSIYASGKRIKRAESAQKKLSEESEQIKVKLATLRGVRFPSTGTVFVTFNYQRAAHACIEAILTAPGRKFIFDEEEAKLSASFAPAPASVLWENLQYTPTSRRIRGLIVEALLLLQSAVSTYAITEV